MKKKRLHILLAFVISIFAVLLLVRYTFFNAESLKGDAIIDKRISIIGDYVFYESKSELFGKARNLKTGKEKIVGIGLYYVNVHDDKLYYLAQRTPNPEFLFRKRGIQSFIETKATPSKKIHSYTFYNGYLFYQKAAYKSEPDGYQNAYIYKMNTDTKQTEELISLRTENFSIADDILYYSRYSDQGSDQYKKILGDGIFGYSLENKEEFPIVIDWIKYFDVYEKNIVYSHYVPGNSDITKGTMHLSWLNLRTNITTEISKDIDIFRLYNSNICYIENKTPDIINIYNCSNGNRTSTVVKGIDSFCGFILHKDKIYYYDKDHNLCIATVRK